VCPTCKGTGKIGPSILLGDDIEKDLKYLIDQGHRSLALHVHPIMAAYLTKGVFFNSIVWKWYRKYNVKLKVIIDNNSPLTQYHFYDQKTEDLIKL
jgi:ribonuclease G